MYPHRPKLEILNQEFDTLTTLNGIYWNEKFHSLSDTAAYVRRIERLARVREELKKLQSC